MSSASRPPRPGSSARSAAPSAPRCWAPCSRRRRAHATETGSRADVVDGVQAVFLVAAPLAALALLVVLRLPELPLQTANRNS